jgi:UDP-2-acetamido-2-deoxy-ribo-hexuluronate aminotransferase
MDFVDLATQQRRIKKELDRNIQNVLTHGQYIMGPEVKELEHKLASYIGIKHAIGCASGTDALLMALMTYGTGPGTVVFTTPFTFVATAEVISLLGAIPVFVDIDGATYNLDTKLLSKAIDAVKSRDPGGYSLPKSLLDHHDLFRPRGIVAVDLFGLPADYDAINGIAEDNGLFVIEDAAQSFGADYKGRKACSLADIACTSFFPAKPLGCYGDGGMCFTDNDRLAEIMRSIRVHGQGSHKYENVRIGINGRLDTLQAAILQAKFDIFPEEIEMRQRVALRYDEWLKNIPFITTPPVPVAYRSAWAQYSILAKDGNHRSGLQKKLQESNIPTAVYYPKPLNVQGAFASLGYTAGAFPISENVASRIFSLPMHPYLAETDQHKIAEILIKGLQ